MKDLTVEEVNSLRQNARSVVRELGLLNDAYFDIGVTLAERHLLIELCSCPYPTISDIAERLLLEKSTASRLIAKAVKKRYIKYSKDKHDKRKRYIQFTETGKKVLNAFEPIAFNQTKEALLTLNPEEIETVYRGIALYAKGLKNSRLRNQSETIESLLKIEKKLKDLGYTLDSFDLNDEEGLYEIFRHVVDAGRQFPYKCNSLKEFRLRFFGPESRVYVCHSSNGEVVAGFYIRPNFPDMHIANAAYMVRSTHRSQGIGTLLIKASLHLAKDLGFRAMQFNMVFGENIQAMKIYQKLGFNIIGANVNNPEGNIMYRQLDDLK